MKRRRFVAALAVLGLPAGAPGQPRMRRVALVTIADLRKPPLDSLVQGLREWIAS